MKVAGIIAEYNPFHNGHQYQIQTLKNRIGADYVVVALSGDFVQRGVPACLDKFTRTRMALLGGADLVIELPSVWATASAESFATGGVRLLEATGIVDILGFGAECQKEDLSFLDTIASILLLEPPKYKETLKEALRAGVSFPTARKEAICSVVPKEEKRRVSVLLATPNTILAIEYLKALQLSHSPIEPVLIPRIGDGYHEKTATSSFASATAIREILFSGQKRDPLRRLMPPEVFSLLSDSSHESFLMREDAFSSALGQVLLENAFHGFADYADCTQSLSNRINTLLPKFQSQSQFAGLLKTKEITHTHIQRALLHILLQHTLSDMESAKTCLFPNAFPYLRILGFRKESGELLHALKQHAQCPILTKVADVCLSENPVAHRLFQMDLYAGNLYAQQLQILYQQEFPNEYTHPIVFIP